MKTYREVLEDISSNLEVLEDMNLTHIKKDSLIQKIIIAPLRFRDADGASVTVIANISE